MKTIPIEANDKIPFDLIKCFIDFRAVLEPTKVLSNLPYAHNFCLSYSAFGENTLLF